MLKMEVGMTVRKNIYEYSALLAPRLPFFSVVLISYSIGAILKFDNEKDLQTYVDAKPHKDYQLATAEQTAGTIIQKLIIDVHNLLF